jgi:aspartyl-tRNA(Asn)/glutamyl-tRNA(Gln) amidotransferase subunit A
VQDKILQNFSNENVNLSNLQHALPAYYILNFAEISSNLARFDGVRYGLHIDGINMVDDYFKSKASGFGPEVKKRIILGAYVLSSGYYDAYYNKANIVRDLIKEDYKKAFEKVDVLITPTTPGPAFKIGEKINDPLQLYLEDIFTVPANLAGIPAISIPCGFKEVDGKRLPLGLQIMAKHGNEKLLFTVAKELEKMFSSFESE